MQLQLEFFWPLTEQIPLDLDYTACTRPSISVPLNATSIGRFTYSNTITSGTYNIAASNVNLDIENTTVKLREKPNFCRRTILKCLGIQWEVKP